MQSPMPLVVILATGGTIVVIGSVSIFIGIVLVWVRSRMKRE